MLPQTNYEQTVATIEVHLAHHRLNPLTLQRQPDRRVLRLAYSLEVAKEAFGLLRDFQLQGSLTCLIQKEGDSLVVLVGAGVTDNAEQCHRFYQLLADQPLELVQVARDGLSLVAVLRQVVLEPLLIAMHWPCSAARIGSDWWCSARAISAATGSASIPVKKSTART